MLALPSYAYTTNEEALNDFHSYELPHLMNRKGQLNGAEAILKAKTKWVLAYAPVGSGKTSFAAWASKYCKVLALVEKKSLQEQYANKYGFVSLPGKNEFDCQNWYKRYPHPKDAELCLFNPNMTTCQVDCKNPFVKEGEQTDMNINYCEHKRIKCSGLCKNMCPYPWAKDMFLSSFRAVTNYKKFLVDTSISGYERKNPPPKPDIIFLDEAHKLAEILISHYSVDIAMPDGIDLPEIGMIDDVFLPYRTNVKTCLEKLKEVWEYEDSLSSHMRIIKESAPNTYVKWERRTRDLGEMIGRVKKHPEHAFFEIADEKLKLRFMKPDLSVFDPVQKIVLMTATPLGLIRELGLDPNEVTTIDIESNFTHEERRIWTFETAPRLNYKSFKNLDDDFSLLCDHIEMICKEYAPWTGIVHMASYRQCELVYDELTLRDPNDNFYCYLRKMPTNQQMTWWEGQKQKGKRICLTPVWGEGVDLPNENINLICKVVYPNAFQEGTFEFAMRELDQLVYNLKIARYMEQQVGRTQRGEDNQYGPKNSFIAILDNNHKRIAKFFSPDFVNRLKVYE